MLSYAGGVNRCRLRTRYSHKVKRECDFSKGWRTCNVVWLFSILRILLITIRKYFFPFACGLDCKWMVGQVTAQRWRLAWCLERQNACEKRFVKFIILQYGTLTSVVIRQEMLEYIAVSLWSKFCEPILELCWNLC